MDGGIIFKNSTNNKTLVINIYGARTWNGRKFEFADGKADYHEQTIRGRIKIGKFLDLELCLQIF